jgi:hypothetical protein
MPNFGTFLQPKHSALKARHFTVTASLPSNLAEKWSAPLEPNHAEVSLAEILCHRTDRSHTEPRSVGPRCGDLTLRRCALWRQRPNETQAKRWLQQNRRAGGRRHAGRHASGMTMRGGLTPLIPRKKNFQEPHHLQIYRKSGGRPCIQPYVSWAYASLLIALFYWLKSIFACS